MNTPNKATATQVAKSENAEQSPVCLIKGHTWPCQHKHCLMAYKKPQYWGISVSEFYNRYEFSEFTVIDSGYSQPHIIPKNPNPGANDGFEIFRQSMNAVTHLAGHWPAHIDTVSREHVEFRWTEFMDSYPVTNYNAMSSSWHDPLDVQEYVYYIGPTDGFEMVEVDINKDYSQIQADIICAVKAKETGNE